ncbi:MAG: GNAT family N-acetyltransferase [Pseudonocardiaceae bacterium]
MSGRHPRASACPTLDTERLLLRPFRESDLAAYTAVLQAEPVRRSLHLPDDVGCQEAWAHMASWLGQWELRGSGQWALEEKRSGAFIGRAGLHHPERADWPGIEVGWTLHPDHWGKGCATEAGARSIAYAFNELEAQEVFSLILPENHRSVGVARRLGFRFLEERVISHFPLMPHGVWRLSLQEWRASRQRPR